MVVAADHQRFTQLLHAAQAQKRFLQHGLARYQRQELLGQQRS